MKDLVITDAEFSPVLGIRARILVRFLMEHSRSVNECLSWAGRVTRGKGMMRIESSGSSAELDVQRLAWSLSRGRPLPEYTKVVPLCSTALCIRPDHLATL